MTLLDGRRGLSSSRSHMDRRKFLGSAGLALAGAAAVAAFPGCNRGDSPYERIETGRGDWDDVRDLFPLSRELIEMSAMVVSSHPTPVANAIERYRKALDENPVDAIIAFNKERQQAIRQVAGRHLDVLPEQIALTDSTTMGVALVYRGLGIARGSEILTTDLEYYVTHESLRLAAERSGAVVNRLSIPILPVPQEKEIVDRICSAINSNTRVLALTWVLSNTGLKMPVRQIANCVSDINSRRSDKDRIIFCLDAVHGFGNQSATLADLGVDFFISGCHKWLFGPRGTGIIAGTAQGWAALSPVIPTFSSRDAYLSWQTGIPAPPTNGFLATPGGFKAFEHLWALDEAFKLQHLIGKDRIQARTAELTSRLKKGLADMRRVQLLTPQEPERSAGIVAFDIEGIHPNEVMTKLRKRGIIGSVAPYFVPHVRLTPSVRNLPKEVDAVLAEVHAIAAK